MRKISASVFIVSCATSIWIAPFACNAADSTLRLIVRFQKGASRATRGQAYANINGELIETFPAIESDLVELLRKSSDANTDIETRALCDHLLTVKIIVACERDRKLKLESETVTAVPCRNCISTAESGKLHESACEVVPARGLGNPAENREAGLDGKWQVSPLWGQHAIGADLASEMSAAALNSGKIKRVPIGNVDLIGTFKPNSPIDPDAVKFNVPSQGNQRIHGDQTSDLVDKPPFGVTPVATWSFVGNVPSSAGGRDNWNSALIRTLGAAETSKAKLFTCSLGYSGKAPRAAIDHLVDSNRIFIQAAGNDYPVAAWEGAAPRKGHILVGSVGPNGIPTPFSQEPVKIYAPSDGIQLSGPNEKFGGTSGAAPLVSGALTNALAFLPDLANEEAEALLERTSLPGFATPTPGILNAYRLAVVASCLSAEWPKSRSQISGTGPCFDQTKLAKEKLSAANALLNYSNCESKRDGLKLLRASYLLEPTIGKAQQLARLYSEFDFRGDASWYETAAAGLGSDSDHRQHYLKLLNEPSLGQHRYSAGATLSAMSRGAYALSLASRLPEDHQFVKLARQTIRRLVDSGIAEDKVEAARRASFLGPASIPDILPVVKLGAEWSDPLSDQSVFGMMTIADGVPNPWAPIVKQKLKGTKFKKF